MGWTDIFPVPGDEMLADYRTGVTAEESAEFEKWFGVKTQDGSTQDARKEKKTAEGKAESGGDERR